MRLLSAVLAVAAVVPLRASAEPAPPEPGSELTVYVMTFGPGREVWERFGHNAIWIHDSTHGTDQAYNYGLFDFRQENFVLRFVRGQMWYWMAGFPAQSYLRQYERDNRSIWVQELDIPAAARLDLQQFLQWNEQPDHKFYHYDYYRDNCSTRIRDALDRAVKGAIQRQTGALPAGTTFRFHTQRLTTTTPLVFTGLLIALGERVDRPISVWEEMFIPMAMRDHLRRVKVTGPGGTVVPLVKAERTLFESTAPAPPDSPPNWISRYFLIGLAIGAGAFGLAKKAGTSGPARSAFLTLAAGWTLLAGLAGIIVAGLWGLTDHAMAACNENLLQMNPLSLALLPLLPGFLRGNRSAPVAGLAAGIAMLSLAGLALQVLPWFQQVNGPVIALALPAHLGVAAALRRLR